MLEGHNIVNLPKVTFADAHKSRRNEGTVEFASRRDMEVCQLFYYDRDHEQNTTKN